MRAVVVACGVLAACTAAMAHGVGEGTVHAQGSHWFDDPVATALVLLAGAAYAGGTLRLWRRAGVGRGVTVGQVVLFAAGWSILALALLSPLAALSDRLFLAHMTEHELIMAAAPPFLVLGRPVQAMLWSLPSGLRRTVGRLGRPGPAASVWVFATRPSIATLLHGAALWLWHVPPLFDRALVSPAWHAAQHMAFFVTAILFWRSLAAGWENPRRNPGAAGAGVFWLFVTSLHMGFLAILLTLAPQAWYAMPAQAAAAFGLSPLEDQQLGGLVMGVPAALVYVAAALGLAARWITASGGRARKVTDAPIGA